MDSDPGAQELATASRFRVHGTWHQSRSGATVSLKKSLTRHLAPDQMQGRQLQLGKSRRCHGWQSRSLQTWLKTRSTSRILLRVLQLQSKQRLAMTVTQAGSRKRRNGHRVVLPGCPSRYEPARSQGLPIPANTFPNELARVWDSQAVGKSLAWRGLDAAFPSHFHMVTWRLLINAF